VKAGLRNAKAKGKQLARPKVTIDSARIVALRRAGRSWSEIATETGWTKGTVQRAYYGQKSCPGLPRNV
jgi:DNA invertase Pin-like site-specific DNA recombinase